MKQIMYEIINVLKCKHILAYLFHFEIVEQQSTRVIELSLHNRILISASHSLVLKHKTSLRDSNRYITLT